MDKGVSKPLVAGMLGIALCVAWLSSPTRGKAVPRLDGRESRASSDLIVPRGPTREEVTRMLSRDAYSYKVRNVTGVERYDGAQLASNSPCEDTFSHGEFASPWGDGTTWLALGIYDGHAGSQVAEYLAKHLVRFVRHSLQHISHVFQEEDGSFSDPVVQWAIGRGFTTLDDAITTATFGLKSSKEPWQDKIKKLELGYTGSCALQSFFDPASSTLHVACTGDSRAVLGRRREDGSWEAIPLSVDQDANNADEVARVNGEHPGETHIINDERMFGLSVLRAFGNARWKIPVGRQKTLWLRYNATPPLGWGQEEPWIRTPPYLTARPVVTSTQIPAETPSFLIMATDGIWSFLTNEQAVNLVALWLEAKAAANDFPPDMSTSSPPPDTYPPFIRSQTAYMFTEERTTVRDDNVAVHLLRNSLGGNHEELLSGRVTFTPPLSRDARDDLTVQVAFFNTGVVF
ncbi:pyruvate dehydrogenase [Podospora appendiculata]|uniref:Pyruvate dehydrogenase n=1 Tax=Podospora appendiculata TaxID=314037 RepID=A0AAE1C9E7_9PEZI|nr:pyruvate dehydrogenase [Podospora appendiculata]